MKFIMLILMLIVSSYSQKFIILDEKCDQNITRSHLFACYDYNYNVSKFVSYYNDANKTRIKNKRISLKQDPLLPKENRVSSNDYYISEYDRGHLPPFRLLDFNKTMVKNLSYMTYIVPFDPKINRYYWKKVEQIEYSMYVTNNKVTYSVTGVIYPILGDYYIIGHKHNIKIPPYFFKCVFTNIDNLEENKCFIMENSTERRNSKNPFDYTIDFKTIENLTGASFKVIDAKAEQ